MLTPLFRPRRRLAATLAVTVLILGCERLATDRTDWAAGTLRLSIDGQGRIIRMIDGRSGRDYRADTVPSPLLSVQVDGVLHPPESFEWARAA
jgi:hypothetical protein